MKNKIFSHAGFVLAHKLKMRKKQRKNGGFHETVRIKQQKSGSDRMRICRSDISVWTDAERIVF